MYNFRTDLASERRDIYQKANQVEGQIDGIESEAEEISENIKVERVKITNENGEKAIGKPMGNYITIDVKKLKIAQATKPVTAKKMGRRVNLRKDWEDVKIQVMEKGLRLKFQDPTLRKKLLATGDEELVEGNPWGDRYWGVCNGSGKNKLGKLLMKIREELQDD